MRGMRVVGLDGREVTWSMARCRVLGDATRPRSGPHLRARSLLARVFPTDRVLEEVPIPGSRLRADFYVSTRGLIVEVHGEQHFAFNPHFHRTRDAFRVALKNDRRKAEFCERNRISLVILKHDEDDDAWERRLREGSGTS